ncbi:ergothioneine biosynthesis protein EgtB [Microcystis elabens FACHB-917]|nr:ergothioneine biosynthesis protein EgtB [Microcystis elabens FACHB-917]
MGSRAHAPADITCLLRRLQAVREHSERLIEGLEPEDLCLQGMADASPAKWHLGHTTWFFETFLLEPHLPVHATPDRRWGHLFNSYYEAVGSRHPRPERGLLTRPAIGEVLAWRRRVDAGLEALLLDLDRRPEGSAAPLLELVELGLQHEQQHQELLLMDLLDGFSRNPLEPAYGTEPAGAGAGAGAAEVSGGWRSHPGGLGEIGHVGGGFHFDNEAPRHRQWLEPFRLAETLVTNAAYAAFIADDGYRRPELWMSEGWAMVQQRGWEAPRYWRGDWEFTLAGRRPRHPQAPVRHLSWFEADAFARWSGGRLPSEAEWELVVAEAAEPGGRPLPQAFGALWQWTASPYRPYPGFRPVAGAVGEYNGKFMSSQFVLRGSSFLTPAGHARPTYRNFFGPHCRWMAAGLRLARDGADDGSGTPC